MLVRVLVVLVGRSRLVINVLLKRADIARAFLTLSTT